MLSASSASTALNVFISYSRRDRETADRLLAELQAQGFEVKIDRRDLAYGEEWQNELAGFIGSSDTVVWLISEASLASRWVRWELGEVERLKKRLVPVRLAEVNPDSFPESLQKIHALPAEAIFDFGQHLVLLIDALNRDADWLKDGTGLLDRARQWNKKGRDEARLLRGRALVDAENWVTRKPAAAPAINSEILDLLLHSRQDASRRQWRAMMVSAALAVIGLGLAAYAWWERNSALTSESNYLSKLSVDRVADGDAVTGALLAISALPKWPLRLDRPLVPEAERSLHDAMFSMREARVLEGHKDDVNTAVFDAADKMILTASDDRTARLWKADTGELVREVGQHSGKVRGARFLANDRLIVTYDESPTIWLWNARDGTAHRSLLGHSDSVKSVEVARSGDRIVSASADWTARVWRLDLRIETPTVLRGHEGPVNTATFSPDQKQVLTSSDDASAMLWDVETGQPNRQLSGHVGPVVRAIFDQAGSRVATISSDGTARVWNAVTGEEIAKLEHRQLINWLAFCPSGRCIVTTAADRVVRIWDVETRALKFQPDDHSGPVMKVVMDPAGRNSAATVGRDGAVFVWDLETGTRELTLRGHTRAIFDASFSSTGEFLVTASRDKTARIWRIPATTTTLKRTNIGNETRTIDVNDNAKLIALGSRDGIVTLLETTALTRLASEKMSKSAATLVRFNEQASQVLLGSEDGSVALYSVPKLELLYSASTDNSEVAAGYFTKTGFSILTLGGSAYVYDGNTLSQVHHHTFNSASAITPTKGDHALVAEAKGAAWIIDSMRGERMVELKGHGGYILHAVSEPSGSIAATAAEDGKAMVWDTTTGAPLDVFAGHESPLSFVALSKDGRYIATASLDQTIRLWTRGATTPLAVYRGHRAAVQAVRFLPSGGMISASQDGEIHLWHFDSDYHRAASAARARLPRCFTMEQLEALGLRKELPGWCRSIAGMAKRP